MSMTLAWTANPSVDLPTSGRVLGMPACAQVDSRAYESLAGLMGQDVVRDHVAVSTTDIATRTKGAFPGNPAWRPPIC